MMPPEDSFSSFVTTMRGCRLCQDHLPFEPRPTFQISPSISILIVGQAPGIRAHTTGLSFNDASGDRLRHWLGLHREEFYNPLFCGLLSMGLCYPGTQPKGGDNPPCSLCAPTWHPQAHAYFTDLQLILLVGKYAQAYYLKEKCRPSLTETVFKWRAYLPMFCPLPHPSWRNNAWLRKNSWFEEEVVPFLRNKISSLKTNQTHL